MRLSSSPLVSATILCGVKVSYIYRERGIKDTSHLALPLCKVEMHGEATLAGEHVVILDPLVELLADVVL